MARNENSLIRRSVLAVWMLLAVLGSAAGAAAAEPPATEATSRVVLALTVDGMINPASADYILGGIQRAEDEGAVALLIRMDTPGGMLESTRAIVKAILNSKVPVIVYVFPGGARAGSAGVFITMAGHVAAMSPGTNIGAAHPVGGRGEDIEEAAGKSMAEKIENDTRAFAESIAERRGRNMKWAADAVTRSVSVDAKEALRLKVIDLIADNAEQLLDEIDGREVPLNEGRATLRTKDAKLVEVEMSLKQQFVNKLADPNIAYLLMTIGFLGIYFELSNPGMIFPGVIGGVCLVLGLVALQVLEFNAAGLALMGLALILFVLEVFVTSYGLLTIGGVIAMALGGLLLFETPEMSVGIDPVLLIAVAVLLGAAALAMSWLVARSQRAVIETGREGLVGMRGRVTQDLQRRGTILVNGELWAAVAEENIGRGEEVVVVSVDGLLLHVRKAGAGPDAREGGTHA